MTLDDFHEKRYDGSKYNCAHFVSDVWKHMTGNDIRGVMTGFLLPPKQRSAKMGLRSSFVRLPFPETPSIVLMTRLNQEPHVGVYIEGKVFHIKREGVEYVPLEIATLGFDKVRFYSCKP